MQSKTMNRAVPFIPLLLMNGMIVAVVRPISIPGIVVMNVIAIAGTLVALRVLKYSGLRIS